MEEVDSTELVRSGIRGVLEDLDPHSTYVDPESFERMNERNTGEYEGIGVSFEVRDGWITVISAMEGGPSANLGIRPGDRIVKIAGESARGLNNEDVVGKLKGPKGTSVSIGVARPGLDKELEFTIVRDKIPIYSVPYAFMLDDGETGYIRMIRFSATTAEELEKALRQLEGQGMKRLVFDLRNNTGGFLNQAIEVADKFIGGNQVIVSTKGRIEGSSQFYYSTDATTHPRVPLIVLINHGSASASEIVAGAIQDHDRGVLAGVTTFGKGLVQRQFMLPDDSALLLTVAHYYTPSGRLIQRSYTDREEYLDHWRKQEDELVAAEQDTAGKPLSYTLNEHRPVYGGGGINPDVRITADFDLTDAEIQLETSRLFFEFANAYATKHIAKDATTEDDFVRELPAPRRRDRPVHRRGQGGHDDQGLRRGSHQGAGVHPHRDQARDGGESMGTERAVPRDPGRGSDDRRGDDPFPAGGAHGQDPGEAGGGEPLGGPAAPRCNSKAPVLTRRGLCISAGFARRLHLLADAQPPDARVQMLAAHAEKTGRLRDVVPRLAERIEDGRLLRTLHRLLERPLPRRACRGLRGDRGEEILRLDLLGQRERSRALDRVHQLAHVSGPEMGEQQTPRFASEGEARTMGPLPHSVQSMLGQKQDVLPALAQRGQDDGHHVHAVVEILAEPALVHLLGKGLVGGGDEAHIHLALDVLAQPANGSLLQHAQELDLKLGGQLADLVQEERPLVGRLHESGVIAVGAGEGAPAIAEEFALQERFGEGAAVDRHEVRLPARSVEVQRLRHQLLAGSGLSLQAAG